MDETLLKILYQDLIRDHSQNPRNFAILAEADCIQKGHNPLCGDSVTIYVKQSDDCVNEINFQGEGCAISMASASLLTNQVKGKSKDQIFLLFELFQALVTGKNKEKNYQDLGELQVLGGVSHYPMRVKCATLAWHTLIAALKQSQSPFISTE